MSFVRNVRLALKGRYQRYRVRRHYGVACPSVVQLPGSTGRIHIDPDDPRAWKILAMAPLFGRLARNQTYWQQACSRLSPTLALDIGLNFGECLFSATYSPTTELHAFEANPQLQPYVTKSRAEHPAREQMHLHFGLVSDRPGPDAEFYVDRRWSGTSTAIAGLRPDDAERFQVVHVPVLSVDSTLANSSSMTPGGTLIFKIDVEGYESRVLRGMQQTLAAPRWAVGLIEFDTQLLKKAGESLDEYVDDLTRQFQVYAFVDRQGARPVRNRAELQRLFRKPEFHTDLLLIAGDADERVSAFVSGWAGCDIGSRLRAA